MIIKIMTVVKNHKSYTVYITIPKIYTNIDCK